MQLGELQKDYTRFQEKKAEVVALVVEPHERVQTLVRQYRYPYPIMADTDHAVSSAYGVYNLLNDNRATPSIFIVDESGLVVWRYVGQDANDRPTTQQILDRLP